MGFLFLPETYRHLLQAAQCGCRQETLNTIPTLQSEVTILPITGDPKKFTIITDFLSSYL